MRTALRHRTDRARQFARPGKTRAPKQIACGHLGHRRAADTDALKKSLTKPAGNLITSSSRHSCNPRGPHCNRAHHLARRPPTGPPRCAPKTAQSDNSPISGSDAAAGKSDDAVHQIAECRRKSPRSNPTRKFRVQSLATGETADSRQRSRSPASPPRQTTARA